MCNSFIDNLMKNIESSVTFKQINVTVSRSGNTFPYFQLVCCRHLTHTHANTHTHRTSLEANVKLSRLYKTMNVFY